MGFAAQAPPRILIVADDLTLQFCSTPRVRELMRRALRLPDLDAYVAATRGSHWTLASQTNGSVVFTADDLEAVLLGARKMVR